MSTNFRRETDHVNEDGEVEGRGSFADRKKLRTNKSGQGGAGLNHVNEDREVEGFGCLADRVKVRVAQRDEEHHLGRGQRESSLLTTYWSKSTTPTRCLG